MKAAVSCVNPRYNPLPHAFGIPVQRSPLALGIPRSRPWYGTDIFWNHPFLHYVFYHRQRF